MQEGHSEQADELYRQLHDDDSERILPTRKDRWIGHAVSTTFLLVAILVSVLLVSRIGAIAIAISLVIVLAGLHEGTLVPHVLAVRRSLRSTRVKGGLPHKQPPHSPIS
jgi:hypothetical protein